MSPPCVVGLGPAGAVPSRKQLPSVRMKEDPDRNSDQRVVRFGESPLDGGWSPVTESLTIGERLFTGDEA